MGYLNLKLFIFYYAPITCIKSNLSKTGIAFIFIFSLIFIFLPNYFEKLLSSFLLLTIQNSNN